MKSEFFLDFELRILCLSGQFQRNINDMNESAILKEEAQEKEHFFMAALHQKVLDRFICWLSLQKPRLVQDIP